ncbi:MAG: hypothetical protein IIU35_05185 [Neisseriaceae bacterium]|nr:hypothetical protein [Neisseriaceae bacterium]
MVFPQQNTHTLRSFQFRLPERYKKIHNHFNIIPFSGCLNGVLCFCAKAIQVKIYPLKIVQQQECQK